MGMFGAASSTRHMWGPPGFCMFGVHQSTSAFVRVCLATDTSAHRATGTGAILLGSSPLVLEPSPSGHGGGHSASIESAVRWQMSRRSGNVKTQWHMSLGRCRAKAKASF